MKKQEASLPANIDGVDSILHGTMLEFFIEKERAGIKDCNDKMDVTLIGYLAVTVPKSQFKINLYTSNDSNSVSHAALVKSTDGETFICINADVLSSIITDEESGGNIFAAICAHEIGHLLGKHLDGECGLLDCINTENGKPIVDISNIEKEKIRKLLTVKTIDQLNQYKKLISANEADFKKEEREFFKLTLMSLVKGGCIVEELEADMKALHFVTVNNLITAHVMTEEGSIFTRLERFNRMKTLQTLTSERPPNRNGYDLEIRLDRERLVNLLKRD